MSSVDITVGVSCVEEIEPLIKEGATEFCGGLMPSKDAQLVNHRFNIPEHNFTNFLELKRAIGVCHKYGKRIFLVVNEPSQRSDLSQSMIREMLKIINAGIDGFILTDFLLLQKLISNPSFKRSSVKICLSSLGNCFNSKTLEFYKHFNINRVILPQHIYASEAEDIIRHSGLETEVFFHRASNCHNLDGRCHFCSYTVYRKNPAETGFPCRSKFNILNPENIKDPESIYSRWGVLPNINSYSNLYDLVKMGISAVKIGLRDKTKVDAKLGLLRHLCGVLKLIDEVENKRGFLKKVNYAI